MKNTLNKRSEAQARRERRRMLRQDSRRTAQENYLPAPGRFDIMR